MNNSCKKTNDDNISPDSNKELLLCHSKISSSGSELELNVKYNNNTNHDKNNILYGNSITIVKPRNIGKVSAFLYIKDFPLIIIGPDCKLYN